MILITLIRMVRNHFTTGLRPSRQNIVLGGCLYAFVVRALLPGVGPHHGRLGQSVRPASARMIANAEKAYSGRAAAAKLREYELKLASCSARIAQNMLAQARKGRGGCRAEDHRRGRKRKPHDKSSELWQKSRLRSASRLLDSWSSKSTELGVLRSRSELWDASFANRRPSATGGRRFDTVPRVDRC
jgi:hypothetical protein